MPTPVPLFPLLLPSTPSLLPPLPSFPPPSSHRASDAYLCEGCVGLLVGFRGPGEQVRCARLVHTRERERRAALRDAAAGCLEAVQLRVLGPVYGCGCVGRCMHECLGRHGGAGRERGLKPRRVGLGPSFANPPAPASSDFAVSRAAWQPLGLGAAHVFQRPVGWL